MDSWTRPARPDKRRLGHTRPMLHSRWRPWKQSERTDTARLVHATGRRASRVKGAARQAARCVAPVCAKRPAEAKAQAAADPGRGAGQWRAAQRCPASSPALRVTSTLTRCHTCQSCRVARSAVNRVGCDATSVATSASRGRHFLKALELRSWEGGPLRRGGPAFAEPGAAERLCSDLSLEAARPPEGSRREGKESSRRPPATRLRYAPGGGLRPCSGSPWPRP